MEPEIVGTDAEEAVNGGEGRAQHGREADGGRHDIHQRCGNTAQQYTPTNNQGDPGADPFTEYFEWQLAKTPCILDFLITSTTS